MNALVAPYVIKAVMEERYADAERRRRARLVLPIRKTRAKTPRFRGRWAVRVHPAG